jgi:hypothetical protein
VAVAAEETPERLEPALPAEARRAVLGGDVLQEEEPAARSTRHTSVRARSGDSTEQSTSVETAKSKAVSGSGRSSAVESTRMTSERSPTFSASLARIERSGSTRTRRRTAGG